MSDNREQQGIALELTDERKARMRAATARVLAAVEGLPLPEQASVLMMVVDAFEQVHHVKLGGLLMFSGKPGET